MASEIIEEEEEDDEEMFLINTQAKRDKIKKIIDYQKSLYFASSSSSSYSSTAASCPSFASSRASNNLLDLMKEGNTSLRRLFNMEHTSLATHMKEYSGSPMIKPILLWGSDTDNDGVYDDPWMGIKRNVATNVYRSSPMGSSSKGSMDKESVYNNKKQKFRKQKLPRTKTFRRLPRFSLWRCRGFRYRLKFRRIRIMICGRIF